MTIEMVLCVLSAVAGGAVIGWTVRHYREIGCDDWVEPNWHASERPAEIGRASK